MGAARRLTRRRCRGQLVLAGRRAAPEVRTGEGGLRPHSGARGLVRRAGGFGAGRFGRRPAMGRRHPMHGWPVGDEDYWSRIAEAARPQSAGPVLRADTSRLLTPGELVDLALRIRAATSSWPLTMQAPLSGAPHSVGEGGAPAQDIRAGSTHLAERGLLVRRVVRRRPVPARLRPARRRRCGSGTAAGFRWSVRRGAP